MRACRPAATLRWFLPVRRGGPRGVTPRFARRRCYPHAALIDTATGWTRASSDVPSLSYLRARSAVPSRSLARARRGPCLHTPCLRWTLGLSPIAPTPPVNAPPGTHQGRWSDGARTSVARARVSRRRHSKGPKSGEEATRLALSTWARVESASNTPRTSPRNSR